MKVQASLFGICKVVLPFVILAVSVVEGHAANKLIVKGTDGVTDQFVVTDNGNVGIGTSSPGMAITISKSGSTGDSSMMFHNRGTLPYNQYTSPSFFFLRNNDSSVNSGLPLSGDRIGSISYGSTTNTGYIYGANISVFTSANWSTTSFPAYISIATTSSAATSPSERMRIDSNGSVVNGGLRLNPAVTRPECNTTNRGTLWFTRGYTDTLEICVQDNGSTGWKTVTLN